jgi:phage N-6-adenine-methyltransferase
MTTRLNPGVFSSASDEWATPDNLFGVLNREFRGFTLDVCATAGNAKCSRFYSPADDGLAQFWPAGGALWMNPPYSAIAAWMQKAFVAARAGALVCCLVPARTDTRWWWSCAVPAEIRFLPGRLKFGDGKNSAPFPSAVVVMWPGVPADRQRAWFWNWRKGE